MKVLTSPLTWRLLSVLVFAGLIAGFWDHLLRAVGAGVALPIAASAILIWILWWRRPPPFLRTWNSWFVAIVFSAALLGILALFNSGSGPLRRPPVGASLGGEWGTAIILDQNFAGAVIAAAITLVGIAFIKPSFTWRVLRSGVRRIPPIMHQLGLWGQAAIEGLHKFYQKHLLHKIIFKESGEVPIEEPLPTTLQLGTDLSSQTEEEAKGAGPARKKPAHDAARKVAPSQLAFPFTGRWQLPSLALLDQATKVELGRTEVHKKARLIEEALASYGVEARVIQINVGPAVTQFGVEPGWDRKFKEVKEKDKNGNVKARAEEVSRTRVKVERISSLANDLALALAASSIRIEAPVPGTSLVGIEVPNSSLGSVTVREVMESVDYKRLSSRSKLAVALGKGTAGEAVVKDLARMPHLLVAGATGSGKTVCLNSIVAALLSNNTPDELKFIMIDPKRVELIAFNGVPHLMTAVVTESEKAVEMLEWVNQEMDNRYRRMALAAAHNIERYNKSSKAPKPMHCLVIVIDELADLMMAKADEVEPRLCRLAQMGRAVGIHLVVATQRPSVDVITGLIKANFPTRISFAVVSQVDSRTILDMAGAEKLLGRGDMLFLSADTPKPKRLQGCLISPEEIDRLVGFWKEQSKSQASQIFDVATEGDASRDPLVEQARQLAKRHKQVSSSFLQRQLRIGSARAERLIQLLERESKDNPDKPPDGTSST